MKSVVLPAVASLVLLLAGPGGCVSRTVEFGEDAGPATSDDAGGLTGLHGDVGSTCGTVGEVHVTCAEGLSCVMGVCEAPSPADAGIALDARSDVDAHADAKAPGKPDTGTVTVVSPGPATLGIGGEHACVVRAGVLECWGSNYAGALGSGDITGPQTCDSTGDLCSPVPVAVSGLSGAVESIAVAGGNTCAMLAGGTVECWGFNDLGQLGNGNPYGPQSCARIGSCAASPVAVSGLSGVTSLAANGGSACAVLSSGAVECWGSNANGELGYPSTETIAGNPLSSVPHSVAGLSGATAVALGTGHACALLRDRTVQCWGKNSYGQLGNGSTANSTTPVPVSNLTSAAAIAAGGANTCALLTDGTVMCWGPNYNGALGLGTSSGPQTCGSPSGPCATAPVKVPGVSGATAIVVGGYAACVLLSDGTVECWGDNTDGVQGNGAQTNAMAPGVVPGLSGVTAIAMTDASNACALLSNGAVLCWGDNSLGQLGNPYSGPQTCTDGNTCSTTPVKVSGL